MIIALITLFTAAALSGIAAYFSIAGLIAIFSATPIPIAIMGGFLELAKLVSASWLYRNWYIAPRVIRYYLTSSVVILSLITSMGIFGYLAKSHNKLATTSEVNNIELTILEQQEFLLKEKITFIINQNNKLSAPSNRLNKELQDTQEQLKIIINKKAPLLQSKNLLEAEVGPLKYIAEFIYGDTNNQLIDKAVTWVIITLIFVFDPLAILLIICANISLKLRNNNTTNFTAMLDEVENSGSDVKIHKSRILEFPKELIDKLFKK